MRGAVRRARSSDHVRGAQLSLASQVIAAALMYALQIVLARSLGSDGFGTYAWVTAWVGPLALLAGLGLPTVALRFLPTYAAEGDHERLYGLIRVGEVMALAASFVVVLLASLLALALVADPLPLLVGLWTIPVTVLVRFQAELARAGGRFASAFALPLVQPAVMLGVALVAAKVVGSLTPVLTAFLPAVGGLAVLPFQRSVTRRRVLAAAAEALPRYETRRWVGMGLALLAVDALYTILGQADALLLGALEGPEAVGVFSAAAGTAALSILPMVAVGAVCVPAFALDWARGDREALRRRAKQGVLWAFCLQAAIAAGILAAGSWLIALHGQQFTGATVVLALILAGHLVNTATGFVGSLLNMTGNHGAMARTVAFAAVLNITLVVVGIELAGVPGAAAGSALSVLVWNVWLVVLVRLRVGIRATVVDAMLAPLRRRSAAAAEASS